MTNNIQQLIYAGTCADPIVDVSQILDTVQVPDGYTIEAALIGDETPDNSYHGLFLHFTPLAPSKLRSFFEWGRKADVLIEFYKFDMETSLVSEIGRRWPNAVMYCYGCLCCNSREPFLYGS